MKKILLLTAVIAGLLFSGCDSPARGGAGGDSDVTGAWTDDKNTVRLEISESAWTFIKGTNYVAGKWSTEESILKFRATDNGSFATGILTEGRLILNVKYSSTFNGAYTLSKAGSAGTGTPLTIKNESFTEITHVIWQNVSFANNAYENSVKSGTAVTQNVQEGAGYIFFRRKTNPITARTEDIVIVEKGKAAEFRFGDNTLIVEAHNPQNTGTLAALGSTVVFFDDAEGEMQLYAERKSFAGYYETVSDLPSSSSYVFYPPKNGSKSIAIGYSSSGASLHLTIHLTKKAKISFWYANKGSSSDTATFSVNGEVKGAWKTDIDWSFLEFTLEAGQTDLIWEKKSNSYCLSLDDILIYYYTE